MPFFCSQLHSQLTRNWSMNLTADLHHYGNVLWYTLLLWCKKIEVQYKLISTRPTSNLITKLFNEKTRSDNNVSNGRVVRGLWDCSVNLNTKRLTRAEYQLNDTACQALHWCWEQCSCPSTFVWFLCLTICLTPWVIIIPITLIFYKLQRLY